MVSKLKVNTYNGFVQALPNPVKSDPVKVLLITEDGSNIPVLNKGAGIELMEYIGANVELEASLEDLETAEGDKALKVRSYTITDGYEDAWYDDED